MPPKDDDDPASTKEVVTKKQKQLLNREELDLNLIAESLGGFVIEGRRRKKYRGRNQGSKPVQTTPQRTDPRDFMPSPGSEVKNPIPKRPRTGGPRVNPGPSPFDIDDVRPGDVGIEDDPRAASYADSDIKTDQRAGRSIRGRTPAPGTNQSTGSRIRTALKDFRKRFGGSKSGGLFPALGTLQTVLTAPSVFQNLRAFNPNYKATEDPKSPLYQPPQPEVERLKPTERKKPVEPKPDPDSKPQVDPSQDPDGDKKKPPVKVKPPVTVNPSTGVGDANKTRSKQGVTPLTQDQLSQIAQGAATTNAIKQAVASRNKKGTGKFKFGAPQQPRGRIGRRQNPQ